jgi:hypothetical protein
VSLTSPFPDEQGVAFTAVGQECFLCCERFQRDPAVHWAGATGHIYLHPECVPDLFIRLARDVWEAKRKAKHVA